MKNNTKSFLCILLLIAIVFGIITATVPMASAAVPNASANVIEMILDYAKEVEIPKMTIYNSIECDANTVVDGMLGITDSGAHNQIVSAKPAVSCANDGDSYVGTYGTFARVQSVLIYKPTKFIRNRSEDQRGQCNARLRRQRRRLPRFRRSINGICHCEDPHAARKESFAKCF